MEINYGIAIPVAVILLVLLFFLIRRNKSDEKEFEKDTIESEIPPESHDKDSI